MPKYQVEVDVQVVVTVQAEDETDAREKAVSGLSESVDFSGDHEDDTAVFFGKEIVGLSCLEEGE